MRPLVLTPPVTPISNPASGKLDLCFHTHAHEDEVCFQVCAIFKIHSIRCELRGVSVSLEIKVGTSNLILEIGRHIAIQQRDNVWVPLNDSHIHPTVVEGFCHFYTYEPSPNYNRMLWFFFIHITDDSVHIRDITQRKDMWKLHAWDRRHDRFGPLAED